MSIIQNLYLDQGATFVSNLAYIDNSKNPIDLSGFSVRAEFRSSYNTANSYTFTASMADESNGIVNLTMSSSDTTNIKAGRYVYDIEVYNGAVVTRIFEGLVIVNPEVTKNG